MFLESSRLVMPKEGINYYDLLESVTCLNERIIEQRRVEIKSDAELIDIICQNINNGNMKRTVLINISHKESKFFACCRLGTSSRPVHRSRLLTRRPLVTQNR